MATLRKIESVIGTGSTTDATTWVTIATDASFSITEIWAVGKDASGNTATIIGTHRGKRVAGVISLIGSLIDLITMIQGSDVVLNTSAYRININGNDIQL